MASRGVNDILTDRRVLDWGEAIMKLETDEAPILVVSKKLGKEKADNQKFVSFEDRPYERWFYVGTVTGSSPLTGLKLEIVENDTDYDGAAAYITVGDLLYDKDKDHTMRVTDVNTTTGEITVTGLYGGQGEGGSDGRVYNSSDTTSDSHSDPADGDRIVRLSCAFPNGGNSADERARDLAEVYNFIQKFQHCYNVDEETMYAELAGEPELDRLMAREAKEIMKDVEYQLLLGDRDARTLSGKMIYTTAGLFHSGITEDSIATADFTESAWRSHLKSGFTAVKGGSRSKIYFAGDQIMEAVDKWGQGRVVINDKLSAALGFEVTSYVTTFGRVNMVWHPLLENDFQGYGIMVDMNWLKLKVYGSDMQLHTAIQDNDAQERKDEYRCRYGLKIGMAEAHRVLKIT